MSPLPIRSPKHCAKRELTVNKRYKKVVYAFSTFFLSIIAFLFLVWAILHPSNPKFSLKEADIYDNSKNNNNNNNISISSTPSIANSSIELTLLSKNPNKKVGIYYENLQVCALYKGEKVTNDTALSPFYQGHEEMNILSANLARSGQPLGPTEEEMVLSVRGDGWLRWKIGTWVSGSYKINVLCVAIVNLEPVLGSLRLKQETQCSTSV